MLVRTLAGHTGIITDVDFRYDSGLLASSSDDATVRLWDVATGDLVKELTATDGPIGGPVQTVAFSPDGLEPISINGLCFESVPNAGPDESARELQ